MYVNLFSKGNVKLHRVTFGVKKNGSQSTCHFISPRHSHIHPSFYVNFLPFEWMSCDGIFGTLYVTAAPSPVLSCKFVISQPYGVVRRYTVLYAYFYVLCPEVFFGYIDCHKRIGSFMILLTTAAKTQIQSLHICFVAQKHFQFMVHSTFLVLYIGMYLPISLLWHLLFV